MIEGVFLQKSELAFFIDYVIFLNVERKLRLNRVLERDTYIGNRKEIEDKYRRRYFPAEDHYAETISPSLRADLIL